MIEITHGASQAVANVVQRLTGSKMAKYKGKKVCKGIMLLIIAIRTVEFCCDFYNMTRDKLCYLRKKMHLLS